MTAAIDVAYPRNDPDRDGIAGHTERLVAHLPDGSSWVASPGRAGAGRLLVQYNPFSWGRRGVAPGLVRELSAWRRGRPDRRCGLLVHEPAVPMTGARQTAMGAWQRVQLRALVHRSDVVFVTVDAWRRFLGGRAAERAVALPVGSNLPECPLDRATARARLGLDGRPVVAAFSTGHPSALTGHVAHAVATLAAAGPGLVFLNLGRGAPAAPAGLSGAVTVVEPGPLRAADLALHLRAADLALLPYLDGASTRRTTLMAALRNGVPVASTRGASTEEEALPGSVVAYAADGSPAAFATLARELMADARGRAGRERHGARLYRARFDWPLIGATVASAMHAR